MTKAHALVVDDEPDILDLIRITLARMGIQAQTAANLKEAKQLLTTQPFDLCLTDMQLPDGNGIELVAHISEAYPDLPAAMITAHGNMESAVAAMKAGAFDFVSKPVDLQMLRRLVESALRLRDAGPTDEADSQISGQLLGNSRPMREIRRMIGKIARNQAPVFITGESGTGKEVAARLIHAEGPRRDGPFVPVNCGAIPQELVESELFGHKKGSFTGAVGDKQGLFQAAEVGTLFLDEVADLPLQAQVKLLRAIQEKSVRPVGAQQELPVDVRIISASHRDLNAEVDHGSFRQDLFYRINVIELRMPALRERPEDIPLLATRILTRIAKQTGRDDLKLSDGALRKLAGHRFPGNVRELENILERGAALCDGNLIGADEIYLPQNPAPTPTATSPAQTDLPLEDYLGEIEKKAILQALEETRWNRTAAAKKLGMTLRSLRYRLNKLGLD
ncbi:response regulator with CheY-like receiver, AAA-type ATPase, and DNA-binding domains [Thioflavicoccus mobilis 8321]|uniref:Response regulator with CheY-like receiver, AAA-type ATPase, and DNA-binding domains n=1 Tax=Thioflavicoccus mobilis 8321 TaxID=765912 RepID=L0H035_9GAMM|nr:sigma-54 dependent transcriptional regulator [Thioflavicoccus mobilis]AGA90939.1 response regulator with CheY-like receiver, AAA-type ATPase, and DNA-binding domains [Thioflavicoccus mobilis 8321]